MRSLILISAIAIAAADNVGVETELTADCAVDGAESVSDAMDASMFIWASIMRCGKDGEMVKCEVSVASAIKSLNSMVNLLLKATDKCGSLNTVNKECGLAMSKMTTHVAGITASSGAVVAHCTKGAAPGGLNFPSHNEAMCVVNVKNVAKDFFKVVKSFLALEKEGPCKAGDTKACATSALHIIGAFAGAGSYIAGAVGSCSPPSADFVGAKCAATSQALVAQLSDFGAAAVAVSDACSAQPPPPVITTLPPGVRPEGAARLYSEEKTTVPAASSTNLLLAAFLPVTAIVGFVGGRMYGKGRTTHATREFAPMSNVE